MKSSIFLVFLIIFVSLSTQAQERLTPEEMFRWFPEGKYDRVQHYNLAFARTRPGFEM